MNNIIDLGEYKSQLLYQEFKKVIESLPEPPIKHWTCHFKALNGFSKVDYIKCSHPPRDWRQPNIKPIELGKADPSELVRMPTDNSITFRLRAVDYDQCKAIYEQSH